jgi:hypothetical protein
MKDSLMVKATVVVVLGIAALLSPPSASVARASMSACSICRPSTEFQQCAAPYTWTTECTNVCGEYGLNIQCGDGPATCDPHSELEILCRPGDSR